MSYVTVDKLYIKPLQGTAVFDGHYESTHSLSSLEQLTDEDIADMAGSPGDDYHVRVFLRASF